MGLSSWCQQLPISWPKACRTNSSFLMIWPMKVACLFLMRLASTSLVSLSFKRFLLHYLSVYGVLLILLSALTLSLTLPIIMGRGVSQWKQQQSEHATAVFSDMYQCGSAVSCPLCNVVITRFFCLPPLHPLSTVSRSITFCLKPPHNFSLITWFFHDSFPYVIGSYVPMCMVPP